MNDAQQIKLQSCQPLSTTAMFLPLSQLPSHPELAWPHCRLLYCLSDSSFAKYHPYVCGNGSYTSKQCNSSVVCQGKVYVDLC